MASSRAASSPSSNFKPSICSHSLGRAWNHKLLPKLKEAAAAGYDGIELFYEDLEYLAREYPGNDTGAFNSSDTSNDENHMKAAHQIRRWCDELHLEINCLQPFWHYEGLRDREKHKKLIVKLKLWLEMVKVLQTDLIAIPSTFLPESEATGDLDVIVEDLREVADLGLQQTPPVRFAFESLCWGTYIDRWEQAYEVVQKVDRSNFGLCLDTFNIAGRIYADPTAESGKNLTADQDVAESIARLRKIDSAKIFFIQVVDAERLEEPLRPGHAFYEEGQPSRMSWSRNCRLFPFEERAYLPVIGILQAILDTGYTGWLSFELFNRSMNEKRGTVPEEHAKRGAVAFEKMRKHFGWEPSPAMKARTSRSGSCLAM